jgi:hypothetical protein
MRRRELLLASAAGMAGASGGAAAPPAKRSIFELRYYRMRNGNQIARTNTFLEKHYLPASKKAGAGTMGFFSALIAEQSPFVLALTSYPSLAAMETSLEKMMSDKSFGAGFDEYNSMSELSYVRMENSLLRAFETIPDIVVPPRTPAGRAPRIFELRTYESNNQKAAARKVKMFDHDGEMAIFKRLGMNPVFFGETIVGDKLPNLTYMLAYDDLAARESVWKAFAADPEWLKLRAMPGLSDPEIVSNISNAILRPLPYSPIK